MNTLTLRTHLKQAIGLVKHQVLDRFQREVADFEQQVHETTGRGHDNVGIFGQRGKLRYGVPKTSKENLAQNNQVLRRLFLTLIFEKKDT